jgi:hypothetical protein
MILFPWQQRLAACFEIISSEGRQKRRAIDTLDHTLWREPLLASDGEPVTGELIATWYVHLRRLPAAACEPYHRAFDEYRQPMKTGRRCFDEALIDKALCEARVMAAS